MIFHVFLIFISLWGIFCEQVSDPFKNPKKLCSKKITYSIKNFNPREFIPYAKVEAESQEECAKKCIENASFCRAARYVRSERECQFSYKYIPCEKSEDVHLNTRYRDDPLMFCIVCGVTKKVKLPVMRSKQGHNSARITNKYISQTRPCTRPSAPTTRRPHTTRTLTQTIRPTPTSNQPSPQGTIELTTSTPTRTTTTSTSTPTRTTTTSASTPTRTTTRSTSTKSFLNESQNQAWRFNLGLGQSEFSVVTATTPIFFQRKLSTPTRLTTIPPKLSTSHKRDESSNSDVDNLTSPVSLKTLKFNIPILKVFGRRRSLFKTPLKFKKSLEKNITQFLDDATAPPLMIFGYLKDNSRETVGNITDNQDDENITDAIETKLGREENNGTHSVSEKGKSLNWLEMKNITKEIQSKTIRNNENAADNLFQLRRKSMVSVSDSVHSFVTADISEESEINKIDWDEEESTDVDGSKKKIFEQRKEVHLKDSRDKVRLEVGRGIYYPADYKEILSSENIKGLHQIPTKGAELARSAIESPIKDIKTVENVAEIHEGDTFHNKTDTKIYVVHKRPCNCTNSENAAEHILNKKWRAQINFNNSKSFDYEYYDVSRSSRDSSSSSSSSKESHTSKDEQILSMGGSNNAEKLTSFKKIISPFQDSGCPNFSIPCSHGFGRDCGYSKELIDGKLCTLCTCPYKSPARGCAGPQGLEQSKLLQMIKGEQQCPDGRPAQVVIRWFRQKNWSSDSCVSVQQPYCGWLTDVNAWRMPRTLEECQYYCYSNIELRDRDIFLQ